MHLRARMTLRKRQLMQFKDSTMILMSEENTNHKAISMELHSVMRTRLQSRVSNAMKLAPFSRMEVFSNVTIINSICHLIRSGA